MSWMRILFGEPDDWRPVDHVTMWGEAVAVQAPCLCCNRCGRHDSLCPYIEPDDWYAAECERMRERAPA